MEVELLRTIASNQRLRLFSFYLYWFANVSGDALSSSTRFCRAT